MNNQMLRNAYTKILNQYDPKYFEVKDKPAGKLSGMFLSSVSQDYEEEKNKVMIVGCETAGWNVLKDQTFVSVDQYVDLALNKHQQFFKDQMAAKNAKGRTFFNFARKVAKLEGVNVNGMVYANLFCFDWAKKSPMKCAEFKFIKEISQKVLNAQIETLRPDYILFVNGISSAGCRRDFFPMDGENQRCTDITGYPEMISKHYLLEFMLDEKIKCWRTHHPSAYSQKASRGRYDALKLLSNAVRVV